jgi:hypothetical protein
VAASVVSSPQPKKEVATPSTPLSSISALTKGFGAKSGFLKQALGQSETEDVDSDIIPATGIKASPSQIEESLAAYFKETSDGILASTFEARERVKYEIGKLIVEVPSDAVAARIRNKSLEITKFIAKRTRTDAISIEVSISDLVVENKVPYSDNERLQYFINNNPYLETFIQQLQLVPDRR